MSKEAKKKKIRFLFNDANLSAAKVMQDLATMANEIPVIISNSPSSIPIMWLNDECYTGVIAIRKIVEKLKSQEITKHGQTHIEGVQK